MRFRWANFPTVLAILLCSCATTKPQSMPGELVVLGRLENLNAEPTVVNPDDILGPGWFNARLHISRVVRGRVASSVIPVRYFGHTYLSERQRHLLKLYRDKDGTYFVCASPGQSGVRCPSDRNGS